MKHPHHATRHQAQPTPPAKSSPAAVEPAGHDDDMEVKLREAAYFRYLARGAELGHDLEDWLQAESQMLESGKANDASH
jgi:hypothetical protein